MAGRIVYVSCADECEIGVFRMDPESGHLKQVATTLIPGLNTASPTSPLAISPNRRFLYAALRLPPFPVSSFSIDPTDGTLALLGTALLPDSMAYITTDRAGGWLLGASYASGIVSASAIGMNGLVRAPAAQIAKTPPKAHSVILDAANRFAYAACLGGDALLCWAFNAATGLVAPDAPRATSVRAGSGPRHLAFGRGGEVLYAINELDGTIDVFGRDPNSGVLDARQTAATLEQPAVGDAAAADIHLTPDGRFLYASIRRDSVIAAFSVDRADGTLTFIDRFAVETTPRGFAIDPDGRFLLCAGRDAAMFGVYAIDPADGRLEKIAQHTTSPNPNWIEIIDLP